jgi:hypothetical protein
MDVQNKYKILRTVDGYPGKKNCYEVEVIPPTGEKWIVSHMPIEEYNLTMELKKLYFRLSSKQFKSLVHAIEEYGYLKFDNGMETAYEENAAADY